MSQQQALSRKPARGITKKNKKFHSSADYCIFQKYLQSLYTVRCTLWQFIKQMEKKNTMKSNWWMMKKENGNFEMRNDFVSQKKFSIVSMCFWCLNFDWRGAYKTQNPDKKFFFFHVSAVYSHGKQDIRNQNASRVL